MQIKCMHVNLIQEVFPIHQPHVDLNKSKTPICVGQCDTWLLMSHVTRKIVKLYVILIFKHVSIDLLI
jgi:hypothetical protein